MQPFYAPYVVDKLLTNQYTSSSLLISFD